MLTQAFLWRLLDLDEADGRPIDLVDRDQVPLLRRHATEQGRLARCTSSARRTSSTAPSSASSASRPEDRARGARPAARPARARRGAASLRHLRQRRRAAASARPGIDAEVLPHPPQELAYRTDAYEGFVLSVNRLDRAKRIDLLIEAAAAAGVAS